MPASRVLAQLLAQLRSAPAGEPSRGRDSTASTTASTTGGAAASEPQSLPPISTTAQAFTLPAGAGVAAIVAGMQEHGYCCVRGIETPATMAALRAEMDAAGFTATGTEGNAFADTDTLRNSRTVLRSSPLAQHLCAHPLALAVVDAVLLPYCKRVRLGAATRITKVGPARPTQRWWWW